MVSRKDLNSAELENRENLQKSDDGCDSQRGSANKRRGNSFCRELALFVTVMLSRRYTGSSLTRKTLRRSRVYLPLDQWTRPQLINNGRRIECNMANGVPFVVPGLSTSSSSSFSPTSSTSLSQEAVTLHCIPHQQEVRVSVMEYEETRRETENPNKNDNETVRGDPLRPLPERPEEFKENLVDDSVPEHRDAPSSSHELPSEPRAKVVSGKHSIFTHFPKDRNCDICLRTKITRVSCRRRNGTVVPRAGNFGDLVSADHKVLK